MEDPGAAELSAELEDEVAAARPGSWGASLVLKTSASAFVTSEGDLGPEPP